VSWVHVTHPDTGGEGLVPDDADVLEAYTARGWVQSDAVPAHLDPNAPNTGAVAAEQVFAPTVDLGELPVDPPPLEAPAPGDAPLEAPAAPSGKAPKSTPAAAASVDTTGE